MVEYIPDVELELDVERFARVDALDDVEMLHVQARSLQDVAARVAEAAAVGRRHDEGADVEPPIDALLARRQVAIGHSIGTAARDPGS